MGWCWGLVRVVSGVRWYHEGGREDMPYSVGKGGMECGGVKGEEKGIHGYGIGYLIMWKKRGRRRTCASWGAERET